MELLASVVEKLIFGFANETLDVFTDPSPVTLAIGSGGVDVEAGSLGTPLAEQSTVSSTYELFNLQTAGERVQVSKYTASFSNISEGAVSEIGLRHTNGEFFFLSNLTTDGTNLVKVTPDYAAGESITVEVVLLRSTTQDPVTVYTGPEGSVEIRVPGLVNSLGETPFVFGSTKRNKLVYRTSSTQPLTVYSGVVDDYLAIEKVDDETAKLTIDLTLWPSDEFYNPFPVDELIELRLGTDSVEAHGVLQVMWSEPQTRPADHAWVIKLSLLFGIRRV